MKRGRRLHQSGFSLLEVLVAFSIMAMALAALHHAVGGSIRGAGHAESQTHATVAAESLLRRFQDAPPEGLDETGRFGDFDWHARSVRYPVLDMSSDDVALQRIVVDVAWTDRGRTRQATLTSLIPERR